jgi:CRP-like cAMP-binding protein
MRRTGGGRVSTTSNTSPFPKWLLERKDFAALHEERASAEQWVLSVKKKPQDRSDHDLDAIASHLKSCDTFDHLKMEPESLAEALHYKNAKPDTLLCNPGESGTYYYVLSGSAKATLKNEDGTDHGIIIEKGRDFGSLAETHIKGLNQTSVFAAANPTEILYVQKDIFDKLALAENVNLLKKNSLFQGFSQNRLATIAKFLKPKAYAPGKTIIRQGDLSDGIYFVKSGVVAAQKDVHVIRRNRWPTARKMETQSPNKRGPQPIWEVLELHIKKSVPLCRIEPGGMFGEKSCYEGEKRRQATVRALSPVHVLFLSRNDFFHHIASKSGLLHLTQTSYNSSKGREYSGQSDKLQTKIKKMFDIRDDGRDTISFTFPNKDQQAQGMVSTYTTTHVQRKWPAQLSKRRSSQMAVVKHRRNWTNDMLISEKGTHKETGLLQMKKEMKNVESMMAPNSPPAGGGNRSRRAGSPLHGTGSEKGKRLSVK